MNKIEKFCVYAMWLISIAIIGLLFLASFISTSYLSLDIVENITYSFTSWPSMAIVICFAIAVILARKYVKPENGDSIHNENISYENTSDENDTAITKKDKVKSIIKSGIIFLAVVIPLMILVHVTGILPFADRKFIVDAATNMHLGDFSDFEKGGYMYVFPNQYGIVLYIYLIQAVFGIQNIHIFQYINALWIGGIVLVYFEIAKVITGSKKNGLVILAFIPIFMYVVFIYGNIPGLFFTLIAILYALKLCKNKKILDGMVMAISMTIAYQLKMNFVIVFIAILICLVIKSISLKSIKIGLAAGVMVIAFIAGGYAVDGIFKHITGIEKSEGAPTSGWIVMGLEEGGRASGWNNGYNYKMFSDLDFDVEAKKEVDKERLQLAIERLTDSPVYFVKFFGKKVLSQWNEPTYACFWIGSSYHETKMEGGTFLYSIFNTSRKNDALNDILDAIKTIALFGALVYLIYLYKDIKQEKIGIEVFLPLIVVTGGFLFHLLWEGKSQYIFNYMILIYIYSIEGYKRILRRKKDAEHRKEDNRLDDKI